MEKFAFSPTNGFRDSSVYGNPLTGVETRQQLQSIPDQLKDYINQIVATYDGDVVSFKVTNDLKLQFSLDGTTWQDITSGTESYQDSISIATTDWAAATYGFSCTKTLTGVESTSKVHFSVEVDMTSADYQALINARAFVQDVVSGNGSVTIYATTKPAVNITLDVWWF